MVSARTVTDLSVFLIGKTPRGLTLARTFHAPLSCAATACSKIFAVVSAVLSRPGYWQNRGGFAFSPHILIANAKLPLPPSSAIRKNQSEREICGLGLDPLQNMVRHGDEFAAFIGDLDFCDRSMPGQLKPLDLVRDRNRVPNKNRFQKTHFVVSR